MISCPCVSKILGYSNTKDAINTHVDSDDKRIIQRSEIATIENHIPKSALPVNFVPDDIPNRGLTINNEPWFVGKDVAQILGYERPAKAVQDRVDVEDKDEVPIQDSIGRMQKTPIINESGLYSLILSSKLPGAKKFKRWVTSEVLPSIRRNGGYIEGQNRTKFVRGFIIFQASPFQKHPACFSGTPIPRVKHRQMAGKLKSEMRATNCIYLYIYPRLIYLGFIYILDFYKQCRYI